MKLFLLIHEQDTDAACGSSVDLFSTLEAAQPQSEKHIWMRWQRLSSWKRWRHG